MIEIYQRPATKPVATPPAASFALPAWLCDRLGKRAKRDLGDIDLGAAKVTGRLITIPAGGTRDN